MKGGRWGKGQFSEEVAYSPDDELLAVGTSIGIYLYDAETLSFVAGRAFGGGGVGS